MIPARPFNPRPLPDGQYRLGYERIYELRRERCLSIRDVAELTELSRAEWNALEAGRMDMSDAEWFNLFARIRAFRQPVRDARQEAERYRRVTEAQRRDRHRSIVTHAHSRVTVA